MIKNKQATIKQLLWKFFAFYIKNYIAINHITNVLA